MSFILGTLKYYCVEVQPKEERCASCGITKIDRWFHDPCTVLIGGELFCKSCVCTECRSRIGIEVNYLIDFPNKPGKLCFSCYRKILNKKNNVQK
jgi:hypothetical protein